MTTQTPIHINDRFFSKASRYFSGVSAAVTEVLQNAYRASLPMATTEHRPVIEVQQGCDTLQVRDHGRGVADVGAMLSIADSRWGDGVEEEQDPAGMGLCGVMAACKTLIIQSTFGSLTVDCERFFSDGEYRDGLLEDIDQHDTKQGTEVTMIGLRGEVGEGMIFNAAKYHAAVRVKYNGKLIPSVIDENPRITHPDGEPYTHQGYAVYRYKRRSGWETVQPITVVWHGQCIQVQTDDRALERDIPLPGGGTIRHQLETGLQNGLLVVIDHGAAPITPRLPDRASLVYDEKTVEFLWGLAMPFLQQSLTTYDEFLQQKAGEPLSDLEHHQLESDCIDLRLPAKIEHRMINQRLNVVCAWLPAPNTTGQWGLMTELLPADKPLYELQPQVVLRYKDGSCEILETDDLTGDPLNIFFAPADGTYSGCTASDDMQIPDGVIAGIYKSLGSAASVLPTVMVLDLPCEQPKYVTNNTLTDRPLMATFHAFADEPDNWLRDVRIDSRLPPTPEGCSVFQAEIPGVVVTRGYNSYDPDDHVWLGERQALIRATSIAEAIYQGHDWDDCEDAPSARDITGWFDRIRRELGAAANIRQALQQLLDVTVGYRNPRHVQSVSLDHEAKVMVINLSDGEQLTQRFAI